MSRAQKPYEVSGHHSTEHGVRPSHLYISLFRTIQKQREKFLFTAWQGKAGAWLLRYVGKWGDILSRTLILSSTMKPKKKKSPGDSDSKESACIAEDLGCIPGLGRSPGGGHGNPLHYSCLENFQGQKGLVGDSPWGHRVQGVTESDRTEQLSTAQQEKAQR